MSVAPLEDTLTISAAKEAEIEFKELNDREEEHGPSDGNVSKDNISTAHQVPQVQQHVLKSIMEHDLGSEFTTMKERAMD